MDAISNPYTPGSGVAPAELAGRDEIRAIGRVAIERIRRGLPAKSLLMVGLRGVGKTVLLDRMRRDAEATGIQAVRLEESGSRSLPALLAPELRLALLRLSRLEASRESAILALRALAGFASALNSSFPDIEVGLDYEPEPGLTDSGILRQDLQTLLESVGTATQRAQTAVVLFIDEMQFVAAAELAALAHALQRCAQRGLPIGLVGAGLPQLRLAGEAGTHAEQRFDILELGPLSSPAAAQALLKPAADLHVELEEAAVANILAATQCHPYFLQELAKQTWDVAPQSPITLQDTRHAARFALASLDETFFRTRFNHLTRAEKKYMRAMAELGPGVHRSGEIAAALNRPVTSLGPARSQLIAKGMIWSPGHGDTAFTVPRFDEYMRRSWPDGSWRN
jgi:AAA ATPase-like protein